MRTKGSDSQPAKRARTGAVRGLGPILVGSALLIASGPPIALAQPLTLDTSYAPRFVRTGGVPVEARLYPLLDGGFLVTGWFTELEGMPAPGIARLRADGSRDPAFTFEDGLVTPADFIIGLDDGRFVVLQSTPGTDYGPPFVVACRYLADGAPDGAFPLLSFHNSIVRGVARSPDGRHIVYGQIPSVSGSHTRQGLIRLAADGTFDPNYSPAIPGAGPTVNVCAVVVAPDGSVVAATGSRSATVTWLGRFAPDGVLDAAFAPAPPRLPLAIQADNKVICGGLLPARLLPDGSVDSNFTMWAPREGPFNVPSLDAATVLPDGRFLADISIYGSWGVTLRLEVRSATGALVGLFGGGELHTTAPDGRIVTQHRSATGVVYSREQLGRYESVNPTFGLISPDLSTTNIRPDFGFPGVVESVAIDAANRAIASGQFNLVDGAPRPGLARIQADGAIDTSFVPPTNLGQFTLAALEPDGHVLVHRSAPGHAFGKLLERLNPDGSVDTSLPADCELRKGWLRLFGPVREGRVLAAVQLPDPPSGFPFVEIAHFDTSTGERVKTWPVALLSYTYASSFFTIGDPKDVLELNDGSLLLAAAFREVNGASPVYTVNGTPVVGGPLKISADGTVDAPYRARLAALRVTSTHQLLPRGRALVYRVEATTGITPVRLVCLDVEGNIDPNFEIPTVVGAFPKLVRQFDESLVALGSVPHRWRADGSLDRNTMPTFSDENLDFEKAPNLDLYLVGAFGLRRFFPVATSGISLQPSSQTVAGGQSVFFRVAVAESTPATYQWQHNGADISGATQADLVLHDIAAADAGSYRVVVRVGGSIYTSEPADLRVVASTARLINFSARSRVRPGALPQIAGMITGGSAPHPVLLRAIELNLLERRTPQVEPRLRLCVGPDEIAANAGHARRSDILELSRRLGAFDPPMWQPIPGIFYNRDSALVLDLREPVHTAQTSATLTNTAGGICLFEFYDAASATDPDFVKNVSLRGRTAPGHDTMMGGLVIAGEGGLRLLLRVVGPELEPFGVTDVLADPRLTLFRGSSAIASNDDWETQNAPARISVATAMALTSAFPLAPGSHSAALVAVLQPGAYTFHATGAGDAAGEVLLEVYRIDE